MRFKRFLALRTSSIGQNATSVEIEILNSDEAEEIYLNVDLITRVEKAGFQHVRHQGFWNRSQLRLNEYLANL